MKKNLLLSILIGLLVFPVAAAGDKAGATRTFDLARFRICLVQMNSAGGDKTANLARIETFAAAAAARGARIICFPELSISGYETRHPQKPAETIPGDATRRVLQMAVDHRIVILAGLIEKDAARLYITQITAFPDGRIEKYRKTHPGRLERTVFSAGEALPVFRYRDRIGQEVGFGIALCYDMHFPEVAAGYSLQGAQIIFAPHASPLDGTKRVAVWNKYLVTFKSCGASEWSASFSK